MHQTISHYRMVEPLGSGGAGYVWKAEDLRLKRTVAIKCLQPDLAQGGQAIEQLQSEAQMAAALNHPNIATIYEVVESSDQFYLVMEFVEGETLKSRIERGPLDINASLEVATQVADALRAAHARGLIHCDIKSSNIMITPDGQAKVLDFGLAKIADSTNQGPSRGVLGTGYRADGLGTSIEREGFQASKVISGTPGFMSPEQVRGEGLDQRTDIFSLGVVLYEMLTARMPFHGDGPLEVFHSVLTDEPASLGAFCDDAPLELERIVRRALAKRREERYAAMEDLLCDLRALKGHIENREPIEARFARQAGSGSAAADTTTSVERDRLTSLRAFAWRHRRSLLLAGTLAASMAVWDIISLQPHGAEWSRAAGLLAFAAACAVGYVTARQGALRTFNAMPSGAAFRGCERAGSLAIRGIGPNCTALGLGPRPV
jgi:serine/threonine protein kinase